MAMHFKVGQGTANVLLNRGHKDAAYRQSDLEHEQTLNQFVHPGMTEIELLLAQERGADAEELLEKYWDNDRRPREDFSPSSSFITDIMYDPRTNVAHIQMNGGKYYRFPNFSPDQMGDMLTGNSLGGYLWDNNRWETKFRKKA